MDDIAQLAAQPLVFERIDRHRRVAAFGASAAAAGEAIRQMRAPLHDVDGTAVGADDTRAEHVRHRVPPRRTIQIRWGPPMKAVIAPAGISAGATTTRPMASQEASSTPPSRKAHGISTRSSAPRR